MGRDGEPDTVTCQREIEALHAFFVDWYTGADVSVDRLERALAPEFVMISPGGERVPRERVCEMVRGKRDEYEPGAFEIDVRNVETVEATDDLVVMRYEEWQRAGDGENGRISTACFRADPAAPEGVAWTALHETWLDPPAEGE